jgi:hypothetical protein
MRDYRFFVYMSNSSSRRALYTGMTSALIYFVVQIPAYTGTESKNQQQLQR